MPGVNVNTKPNLRNTRTFREELLAELGVTADKDVENEYNFKSALLDALGVNHTPQDVTNFERYREKLCDAAYKISSGGGGGGGESDFSTAKVSVENNTEALINGMFVALYDTPFSAVVPENTLPSMSRNYNVPLYKGVCSWSFMVDTISVSGNIEWDSENRIALIKGDGTITVS